MKREDELQQEYEDILFKIMMDRVAQAEGARLLEENQQLLETPDAEVPQDIQKHAYKTIQTPFIKKKRRHRMGSLRRGLRVAVIAAILVALLTGVTFAAFPDVRAKVINTILDIYDTHTNFSFDSDVEKKLMPTSSELDIHVGWLPENFTKVNDVSNGTYTFERYENGEKVIRICKSLPYSIAVDTENAEITSIDIHGYEATLVKKSPEHSILWLNTDTSIVYFIYTNGVSPEIMLKIAENIS